MNQTVAAPQTEARSAGRKGMPVAGTKYSPFPVPQLDDRTWPSKRIEKHLSGARSICAMAIRP